MALYALHDLTLEVRQQEAVVDLETLLHDLSCIRLHTSERRPSLSLTVRQSGLPFDVPCTARAVFHTDGLTGFESGRHFYLATGASLLHLYAEQGWGEAQLAPAFFHQPPLLRQQFWAFGLLKLLRPLGVYGLHAAGVVTGAGQGLLITGDAGSGKSTLTIGLVRQGWRYLSDDAVLLRAQPEGVEMLALRKPFSVNADAAAAYADLPLGEENSQTAGKRKRRVDMHAAYPEQYVPTCRPRTLLVSRIVSQPHSTLRPLERLSALRHLLVQSGPQLFDHRTMAQHLEVLKRLVHQAVTYELLAGRDLYHFPGQLVRLLADVEGEEPWLASSLS